MRRGSWFWLVLLIGVSAFSSAGDIQVLCEPGLRGYLDGEFVGTSSALEDGLFLIDIMKGAHTLRLEKDGFLPQSFQVDVFGSPVEVVVGEFVPKPLIEDEVVVEAAPVTELVGNLVVTSAPQNCVVEIDGRSEEKNTPELSIGGLSAGEHTITFSKMGFEPISGVVTVHSGAEVTVRGNLKAGKVELIHAGKGSLRVISTPARCTVRFFGKTRETIYSRLNMSHIPAGEHEIVVSISGRRLTRRVLIIDRHRTIVKVNFIEREEPFVVSHEPLG